MLELDASQRAWGPGTHHLIAAGEPVLRLLLVSSGGGGGAALPGEAPDGAEAPADDSLQRWQWW